MVDDWPYIRGVNRINTVVGNKEKACWLKVYFGNWTVSAIDEQNFRGLFSHSKIQIAVKMIKP